MKKFAVCLFFVFLVLALSPQALSGQMGSVSGRVTDPLGAGIANIRVESFDSATGRNTSSYTTQGPGPGGHPALQGPPRLAAHHAPRYYVLTWATTGVTGCRSLGIAGAELRPGAAVPHPQAERPQVRQDFILRIPVQVAGQQAFRVLAAQQAPGSAVK
jgi:hypothetical protein